MPTSSSPRRGNVAPTNVVVVGAGVVGAAISYRLAAGGARVVVLDAGTPGSGTSARSFAWLNGNDKRPAAYGRLNAEGIEAHRRLGRDLGQAGWLHESGNLMFTPGDPAPLEARVGRLRALDYPAELIDTARAAGLEPRVDFSGATAVAWFPGEAWAHGPTLVATLVEAARARGARLLTGSPATALDARRDGVGVVAGGERLDADQVVIAAGRFSDRVAALAGARLPLAPTCGLLAVTAPVADGPRRIVHAPGVHLRPEPGGRLVLQDDETDRSVGPDSPEDPARLPGVELLLGRARAVVPALRDGRIEAARVGIRPMPRDGYPVVGRLSFAPRLYLAVTHSGMTLGPLLGELVAGELLSGQPSRVLADYRPERCVTAL
jgi:glycine/D-amino acid oxidase-like deaminating enzyme